MIFKKYFHDIVIGFEAIIDNKLKSILTALGIIFGVAAVIKRHLKVPSTMDYGANQNGRGQHHHHSNRIVR